MIEALLRIVFVKDVILGFFGLERSVTSWKSELSLIFLLELLSSQDKLYELHEVRLVFLDLEDTSVQYSTYRVNIICFSAYLGSKRICFL